MLLRENDGGLERDKVAELREGGTSNSESPSLRQFPSDRRLPLP